MANILPILRNTSGTLNAQVLYPFTRVVSCLTNVDRFQNAMEQRSVARLPLFNFSLPMSNLKSADISAWKTFFSTVKGRDAVDLQLSLGATTYSHLTLMSDDLAQINPNPGDGFHQSVSLRQTSNLGFSWPSYISAFPSLKFGAATATTGIFAEYPFTQGFSFLTDITDSPYGQRQAWAWFAAGLTNFPTGPLRSWSWPMQLITDQDAATLENFFLSVRGMYRTFSFRDPVDGVTYSNVRFASDSLSFKYLTLGHQQTNISLVQINA